MADEDGGGKTDPLSKATRATKRNLLVASVTAITFRTFAISADKIPFAGVTITYDKGVFEFLLAAVTFYFLVAFVLYYYIDIKNFPRLDHQYSTEKWREAQLQRVAGNTAGRIESFLRDLRKDNFQVGVPHDFSGHLSAWVRGAPGFVGIYRRVRDKPYDLEAKLDVSRSSQRGSSFSYSQPRGEHRTADEAEAARKAVEFATRELNSLPRRYIWAKLRTGPVLWTVRAAYFFRNYGLDGVFPIVVAMLALLALYNVVPLHWLAALAPSRS